MDGPLPARRCRDVRESAEETGVGRRVAMERSGRGKGAEEFAAQCVQCVPTPKLSLSLFILS
jgi:hypothetical protein